MKKEQTPARELPSVEVLVSSFSQLPEASDLPRPLIVAEAQQLLTKLRNQLHHEEGGISRESITEALRMRCQKRARQRLQPVINATGIINHTNLGRAPIAAEALAAAATAASGYTNLEFDLDAGVRGKRGEYLEALLIRLTGAEGALIVNNCAAALVLIVNTLATRKEVVISRAELVQIGGGFRIPEILVRSGGKLREVGTTNITTIDDYASALSARTGMILKVHQSNFVQKGFQADVPMRDLEGLGTKSGVPVVYDLGSGLPEARLHQSLHVEPAIETAGRAGAALVCFSGDKLFGGTQAGVIAGKKELIEKIRKNPLFRAVRIDKLTLAVMEKTAETILSRNADRLPIWSMARVKEAELYSRGKQLLSRLAGFPGLSLESTTAQFGGGAAPERGIPSVAICIRGRRNRQLISELRTARPPIIARVEADMVLLDLRTVFSEQDELLVQSLRQLLTLP